MRSLSIDSFFYYGTDDLYLDYLARFIKPGGRLGIAGAGLMREMDGDIPTHLKEWWTADMWCLHSAAWWERHWGRKGIVDVETCDTLPDGWRLWRDWLRLIAPDNATEIRALEADSGSHLGYVRVVGRRRLDTHLSEPILSVPAHYERKPLLRGGISELVTFASTSADQMWQSTTRFASTPTNTLRIPSSNTSPVRRTSVSMQLNPRSAALKRTSRSKSPSLSTSKGVLDRARPWFGPSSKC